MANLDDIDAPTWADFTGPSPQVCLDDYFQARNGPFQKSVLRSEPVKIAKLNLDASDTESDEVFKTPQGKGSSKRSKAPREITYEKVISEAMTNLKLCMAKAKPNNSNLNASLHSNQSFNGCTEKTCQNCLVNSPIVTPIQQRVTRSICSKLNASLVQSSLLAQDIVLEEDEKGESEAEICLQDTSEDTSAEEVQKPTKLEKQDTALISEVKKVEEKVLPKSKVVTSFGEKPEVFKQPVVKKKPSVLTGNAWHREVGRRISLIKNKPQNGGYIGLAEAVNKFQKATPLRFKSNVVKMTRTAQLRKASFKLTRAISPALTCKHRTRPVTVLSTEEREKLELEQMRQHQVKANPVPKSLSKKPLTKPSMKKITIPEPFHLTEVKKYSAANQKHELKKVVPHQKKTMPIIIISDDKNVIVKVRNLN